jgi:hypothetical protein
MKPKEALGLAITVISVAVLFYAFIATGGAVKGDLALAAAASGFALILLGPYLWLGEVPIAIKKFIEAKTGAKLEEKK